MPSSIFIAQLLGPLYVVVGAALLLRAETFVGILQDFVRSPAVVYLAGFLGLLAGTALALMHNVWVLDWRLVITLIGWLSIVRALVTMFRPEWVVAFGSKMLGRRAYLVGGGAMNLLIGLVLSYFGYFGYFA
jgi:uncharacterized membrane protein